MYQKPPSASLTIASTLTHLRKLQVFTFQGLVLTTFAISYIVFMYFLVVKKLASASTLNTLLEKFLTWVLQ